MLVGVPKHTAQVVVNGMGGVGWLGRVTICAIIPGSITNQTRFNFRVYAYDTYGWYNNVVTYSRSESKTTTDRWLLVGRSTSGTLKLFQFGVESQNQRVTTTNWKVINDLPCYYTGTNWQYLPAKVAYGPTAITSAGGLTGYVGDTNYTGVNLYHTQADEVIWQYTGSTVANGTTLWSGSGTVSDSRTAPYQ